MPALPILSAILLLLTLPPFRLHALAAFALAPLLLMIRRQNSFRGSFAAGALAGLLYFGYGFSGVLYFSPLVYLGVLACHVLFLALFCGLLFKINCAFKNDFVFWTAPALVWTALSFLYSYSPLGETGTQVLFSQPRLLEMMQISRVLGVYAVGFLFLLCNASAALLIEKRSRGRFAFVLISLLLIAGNFAWGRKVMAQPVTPGNHSIALIQHNLPVKKEWWLKNQPLLLERYRQIALEAAQKKPSMIVFPSYALPFDAYRQPAFFESLARETGVHLLVSTYVPAIENRRIAEVGQFEMALLYAPDKGLVGAEKIGVRHPEKKIGVRHP